MSLIPSEVGTSHISEEAVLLYVLPATDGASVRFNSSTSSGVTQHHSGLRLASAGARVVHRVRRGWIITP